MAPVADEARGQRAMIHLTQGEVGPARQLVDNIDLSRHQDARTRAMLASVVAEAWARSGDAKKATETLALFDSEDPTFEQIRPQLYRAQAYAAAQNSDMNTMRRALRKLLAVDVRLLGGFMMKKTHPLLQKEAKKILEQSGQVPEEDDRAAEGLTTPLRRCLDPDFLLQEDRKVGAPHGFGDGVAMCGRVKASRREHTVVTDS